MASGTAKDRPIVGLTSDLIVVNGLERVLSPTTYVDAIIRAGGVPIVLTPDQSACEEQAALCDCFVLIGGDDPRTEPFGVPTDPRVTSVVARRQAFESALLEHLERDRPDSPVLGVCLGMQMLALHAGGTLEQWMPDAVPTHADHWERPHRVIPAAAGFPEGTVSSKHRQSVSDAGSMQVTAVAHDGVIEAIDDPGRRCCFGVQWHPERTGDEGLGLELFRRLVRAAR